MVHLITNQTAVGSTPTGALGYDSLVRKTKRKLDYFTEVSEGHDPVLRERLFKEICRLKETTPCVDCIQEGLTGLWHYSAMDFDHVRGKKRFGVSAALRFMWPGKEKHIWAEIAKCEIVCSNHHRIRTHSRLAEQAASRES